MTDDTAAWETARPGGRERAGDGISPASSLSRSLSSGWPLAIVLALYLVIAAVYNWATPLGEGPDEPGHAAYVFFLAREGRLPVQRAAPEASDVPGEGHQPPLAYLLATPAVRWLPREARAFDLPGNPRFTWAGGSELNAVAHGSREFWPWRGEVLAWRLARGVSTLAGAAAVVCTWLAGRRFVQGFAMGDGSVGARRSSASLLVAPIPLLAAALMAFNPQFLFISALVTHDALLAALGAALLWLVVTTTTAAGERKTGDGRRAQAVWDGDHVAISTARVRPSPTALRHTAIGGLLGLALITKQSAVILVPLALAAALPWGGRGAGWLRRSLLAALLILGVAALAAGWWYWRNLRLYGDLFGLEAFRAEFATQPFDWRRLAAWQAALATLFSSFWARFGWMNVRPPAWVIWLYAALCGLALAGWARALAGCWTVNGGRVARQGDTERRSHGEQMRQRASIPSAPILPCSVSSGRAVALLLAVSLLALGWVVAFALTAGLVAWQGRLLFPALPALALLLAWGLVSAAGGRWAAEAAGVRRAGSGTFLLIAGLAALALWLPFGVIRPAYPFQTLPEREALARLGTAVYGRFGRPGDPGAELRGWRGPTIARPGEALALTLMWHANGRQNRDWTVFIHLLGADKRIAAAANAQPRGGAFPMTQWVAGDWVEDAHALRLPPDLPPGAYTLRVGLFDPTARLRAGMWDERGKLAGDSLELGRIVLVK